MFTQMLRELFAKMTPVALESIARDCGVADADNRVDALVAYSKKYSLSVVHWRMRYPALIKDTESEPRRTAIPTQGGH